MDRSAEYAWGRKLAYNVEHEVNLEADRSGTDGASVVAWGRKVAWLEAQIAHHDTAVQGSLVEKYDQGCEQSTAHGTEE